MLKLKKKYTNPVDQFVTYMFSIYWDIKVRSKLVICANEDSYALNTSILEYCMNVESLKKM